MLIITSNLRLVKCPATRTPGQQSKLTKRPITAIVLRGAGIAASSGVPACHSQRILSCPEWQGLVIPAVHQYTVVVAVANPATVGELIETSAVIAKQHNGRLIATSVVPSPDEPEGESRHPEEAFSQAQNLVERAQHAAQARGLECERRVAVGQHIHEGITTVAEAYDADLLVIGMSERAHPTLAQCDLDFDRIVDAVAAHTSCNVLVAKFRGNLRFDRVLVPVARSTHLGLAREIIVALHHQVGAHIDFLHFAPTETAVPKALGRLQKWLNDAGLDGYGRALVKTASDPAEAIISASDAYDVVAVGAPPLHTLQRQLLGSLAEQVASTVHCTTLVMRTAGPR